MQERRGFRQAIIATALLATCQLALLGCRTRVIYTVQPHVLVEQRGADYVQLDENDPRYEHLTDYLLADSALARLLQAYESTTAAFAAANLRSPARVAVVNHVVIVLGAEPRLLRDIPVRGVYDDVIIEFALGVPVTDPAEFAQVAPVLARSIGEALMGLAGRELAATPAQAHDLFAHGLGAALEAQYREETSVAHAALAGESGSTVVASACPEIACEFMRRLLIAPVQGYPQRYMLWFANYQARDEALAKILLVAHRTPQRATLKEYADVYAAAFPGERGRVMRLVAELLETEISSALRDSLDMK